MSAFEAHVSGPQMHSDSHQATEATAAESRCPVCNQPFRARRKWQRFCSPKCRNEYHGSMTTEALRRDIDALKARLEALEARVT